jgi:hypothetical protein
MTVRAAPSLGGGAVADRRDLSPVTQMDGSSIGELDGASRKALDPEVAASDDRRGGRRRDRPAPPRARDGRQRVMPFPFFWIGAVFAGAILVGVFSVFAVVMRTLDRAATEVTGTILPGLVEGFRDWPIGRHRPVPRSGSPRSSESGPSGPATDDPDPDLATSVEELPIAGVRPVRLRPRIH